jgi:hypothetical protein
MPTRLGRVSLGKRRVVPVGAGGRAEGRVIRRYEPLPFGLSEVPDLKAGWAVLDAFA